MTRLTDSTGHRIELGPLLAKGGEGAVYSVLGQPDTLAKIYTIPPDSDRVGKIIAMSAQHHPDHENICAWPRSIVKRDGTPVGLTMKFFGSRKELHELFGPKSRKQNFPEASYAFLVHAALNIARATAWLHNKRVFIGDFNERGVLIARNGTVRLIDCDSFQFNEGSRAYMCDVGTPLYTAPELQGKSLRGMLRTPNHDNFALAVLIFQTLFMGRHPFAGSFQGGNKEIHEAIAENRYVYSSSSHNQMIPPPNMMAIDQGAGSAIKALFESAFSRKAAQSIGEGRPTAKAWISALSDLRQDLVDCPFNAAHQFVKGPRSCPWCELELRTNVDYFNFISTLGDDDQAPDIDAIWHALGALHAPRIPPIESLKRITVPPARLTGDSRSLRQVLDEAKREAERSHANLQLAAREADKAQRALATFIERCPPNDTIEHLKKKLQRLGSGEKPRVGHRLLYMLSAGTLYWGTVVESRALQALAVVAAIAPTGIDLTLRRFRLATAERLKRRIASEQSRAIKSTPELADTLYTLTAASLAAKNEHERAVSVHQGLSQAAMAAQATFEQSVKDERRRLQGILDASEELRLGAFSNLTVLYAELESLEQDLNRRRTALQTRKEQASQLRTQRDVDLKQLREHDREQQLLAYLDQHYIASANIPGITPALKSALASYAIETAADIVKLNQTKVPGFGTVRTQRMLSWRKQIASGFRYSPTQGVDPEKVRNIDQKYKAGMQKIAKELTTALQDFEKRISAAQTKANETTQTAKEMALSHAQAKANLQALS